MPVRCSCPDSCMAPTGWKSNRAVRCFPGFWRVFLTPLSAFCSLHCASTLFLCCAALHGLKLPVSLLRFFWQPLSLPCQSMAAMLHSAVCRQKLLRSPAGCGGMAEQCLIFRQRNLSAAIWSCCKPENPFRQTAFCGKVSWMWISPLSPEKAVKSIKPRKKNKPRCCGAVWWCPVKVLWKLQPWAARPCMAVWHARCRRIPGKAPCMYGWKHWQAASAGWGLPPPCWLRLRIYFYLCSYSKACPRALRQLCSIFCTR